MPNSDFLNGVDANYCLEMIEAGHRWTVDGIEENVLSSLAKCGVKWLRLRLFNKQDGIHGLEYATELALQAQNVGLTPYISLFLSDRWATAVVQPLTASWQRLSLGERRQEVRAYARAAVNHLKSKGVSTKLYQIGNEIEYGLCGEFTSDTRREDAVWMRTKGTWPRIAALLESAMAGVRDADPAAKFIVHIAHWFNIEFASSFFNYIDLQNIDFDYVGISYYPTSGIPERHFGETSDKRQIHRFVSKLNAVSKKQVIFSEYGYPSQSDFTGRFAGWNRPSPGHPLTVQGQAEWLRSFLHWCYVHPGVAGAFSWSPEQYRDDDWSAFSLFDRNGHAKPALRALASPGRTISARLRRGFARRLAPGGGPLPCGFPWA